MKHIKLILIIAVTAVVGGFIIWHLMWMNDIAKKFKTEQLSKKPDIKETKVKHKDIKGKTEDIRPATANDVETVEQDNSEKSSQGAVKQTDNKPEQVMNLSSQERAPATTKGLGEKTYQLNQGGNIAGSPTQVNKPLQKDSEKSDNNINLKKNNQDKNISDKITQSNKALLQPVEGTDLKVKGMPQPPTSTVP